MSADFVDQPSTPISRKLPPSERDFEIYEAVHVAGISTYVQADKWRISQTRVRQIVRRVAEWLGAVLPPQAKIAREQEVHLARQIAASRFQHQLEEAQRFWDQTQEMKYAGLRIRLTTAQARLGVVGGLIEGLAADAIEGVPVPVWQTEVKCEQVERDVEEPAPHPATSELEDSNSSFSLPPSSFSPPPDEDFSAAEEISAMSAAPPAAAKAETPATAPVSSETITVTSAADAKKSHAAHPLLTPRQPLHVTSVELTPHHPGAAIFPSTSSADNPCPCPLTADS